MNALVRRSVAAVWDVLADSWSYAEWVVGTTEIRAVDEGWPAVELIDWADECVVVLDEHPLTGWGARVHTVAGDLLLRVRNRRMLANLTGLVERRHPRPAP